MFWKIWESVFKKQLNDKWQKLNIKASFLFQILSQLLNMELPMVVISPDTVTVLRFVHVSNA